MEVKFDNFVILQNDLHVYVECRALCTITLRSIFGSYEPHIDYRAYPRNLWLTLYYFK